MADLCIKCNTVVNDDDEAVACDMCNKWTHRLCGTGFSVREYRLVTRGLKKLQFLCKNCFDRPPLESTRLSAQIREALQEVGDEEDRGGDVEDGQGSGEDGQNDEEDGQGDGEDRGGDVEDGQGDGEDRRGDVEDEQGDGEDRGRDVEDGQEDREDVDEEPSGLELSDEEAQPMDVEINDPSMPELTEIEAEIDVEAEERFELVSTGTQRGKKKLVSSYGYSFVKSKTRKETTYWRCSVRSKSLRCQATVVEKGGQYIKSNLQHCHAPEAYLIPKTKSYAELKEIAQKPENYFTPASSLVNQIVLRQEEDVILRPPDYCSRIVNRVRAKKRPADIKDLDFNLELGYLANDTFLRADINKTNSRHLIFATNLQLKLLQHARTWYMDGTFKIVKEPFKQLFSIHAFLKRGNCIKQVPLIFVIMSRRQKKDYIRVFQKIREMLPPEMNLEEVVTDFEKGIWRAVSAVFNVKIRGCAFHWAQAIYRHAQHENLARAYFLRRGGEYRMLRRLLALPFLPHQLIRQTFEQLRLRNNDIRINRVMEYIRDTWLNSTVWPTESWSVYRQPIRTNNDVEGWHNRINSRAGKSNLPFYMLIHMLEEESKLVRQQYHQINAEQLTRVQTATSKRVQGRVFAAWDSFDRTQNVTILLSKCSRLYSPAQ